jgi:hypothetical protein
MSDATEASVKKFNLRGPLFRTRVRADVEAALTKKFKGLAGGEKADRLMNEVTDALIDEAADLVTNQTNPSATVPNATPIPAGGILDWFKENKDLIAKVVALILAALGA